MEVIIKTKNLDLTQDIEKLIEEKIGGLEKFVKPFQGENLSDDERDFIEFFVEIERETMHHRKGPYFKAEARIQLPGKVIVAASQKEDLRVAIIDLKDELQQEIKKYKSKVIELKIRKQKKSENN